MFTEKFMEEMESPFQAQLKRMGEKGAAVSGAVRRAYEEGRSGEAEGLKCLYASMPLSDALDYPVEMFEAYARHGAFLWERGPFAGKVPEKLFAGYVLHHRVNNENLTDHREFFYGELKDKVAGMQMQEALLQVNYWLASQATYRATDGRTASPLCVYNSAYGRCGEESTFGVSVLRSLGIPARQVYVPLWSHCDDNHAWVEAWVDGKWVFFGACEPEEVVNKGWFTGASSRAMLVHSRWLLPTEPEKEEFGLQVMQAKDMCHVLNHLGRYALTTELSVEVVDADGKPQADVPVHFEVMNAAEFGEVATVRTDQNGKCFLRTGKGTLHVTASKGELYGECLINTESGECCQPGKSQTRDQPDCMTAGQTDCQVSSQSGCMVNSQTNGQTTCLITLQRPGETGLLPSERKECWEEMVIYAPKDSPINRVTLTEEQKSRGRERLAEMASLRKEKESRFFDRELAERVTAGMDGDTKEKCMDIMRKACGNQKEIGDFLAGSTEGRYPEKWKLAILESLREKDYRDITADILEENCVMAADYDGKYEDSLVVRYILCPRVWNEMLRPFRQSVIAWLERKSAEWGRKLAEEIRNTPVLAWKLVKENLLSDKKAEYGSLVTSAREALESGYGSEITKEIVCVQILRTLGVPARLDPIEGMPEFWVQEPGAEGHFSPMEYETRTCEVIVNRQEGMEWNYFGNWTMARFEDGRYHTLMLGWGEQGKMYGSIPVFAGKYRVLTANRLPNGNIFAKQYFFTLSDGEKKEIVLEQMEAKLSDMLVANDILDFALRKEDGTACRISELVGEREGLFVWLGEDEEPTEHILNEIYERREDYAALDTGLYFIAQRTQIRENPACRRVLSALPNISLFLDDFGADMEAVARRMYLEPGKLPLAVIIDQNMDCIYGVAGYNVGTGDMILKLLKMVSEQS